MDLLLKKTRRSTVHGAEEADLFSRLSVGIKKNVNAAVA